MSVFHETMRDILEDVQRFLNCTLNCEHLSATSIFHKESLLMKINHLRAEYPQLHLQIINESNNTKCADGLPPYTDMQGNTQQHQHNDYVCSDVPEEDYEVCNSDDFNSTAQQDQLYPGKNQDFLRAGYLGRKGKDRLGGLLNTVQRRWVVLKDAQLLIYNKQNDKRTISQVQLKGYDARFATFVTKDESRKSACFEIVGPGLKTYQFVATDQSDAKQWIEAILSTEGYVSNASIGSQGSGKEVGLRNVYRKKSDGSVGGEVYESLGDEDRLSCAEEEDLYHDTRDEVVEFQDNSLPVQYRDFYLAMWDCVSAAADELSFKRGDLIKILCKEFDEHLWWVGQLNGRVGLVPKQYFTKAYDIIS